MRAAILCPSFPTSDAQARLEHEYLLAQSLTASGWDICLFSDGPEAHIRRVGPVQIHHVARGNTSYSEDPGEGALLSSRLALAEALLSEHFQVHFDLVIVSLLPEWALPLFDVFPGPIFINLHETPGRSGGETVGSRKSPLQQEIVRYCLEQSAGIIFGSPETMNHWQSSPLWPGLEIPTLAQHALQPSDGGTALDLPEFLRAVTSSRPRRFFQIMEALDTRDAVSNIVIRNSDVVARHGGEAEILALFAAASIRHRTRSIKTFIPLASDCYIYHYWGFSWIGEFVRSLPGRKALHYHNITPPSFFGPLTPHQEMTTRGYLQLRTIIDHFDLVAGDSRYNIEQLATYLRRPVPSVVVYPVVDRAELQASDFDSSLLARLSNLESPVCCFVGRIARNKGQHRLIRFFERLWHSAGNRGTLLLIGRFDENDPYYLELEALRKAAACRDNIHMPGSVAAGELYAYYRRADVFLCASEHEGFCIPVVEAMCFDTPVVASDSTALPETLGPSGFLVSDWENPELVDQVKELARTSRARSKLLESQADNLKRFEPHAVERNLVALIDYLQEGTWSPQFSWVDSTNASLDQSTFDRGEPY